MKHRVLKIDKKIIRLPTLLLKGKEIPAGFTLIETLVAATLLIVVLLGPVALIIHSLSSAPFSRNHLIANNLAQEGIELAREVRDNNILCATLGGTMEWNEDPDAPPAQLQHYYEIDVASSVGIACGSSLISTPLPVRRNSTTCDTPLRIDANGMYTYNPSGTLSNFSRCVEICSPPNRPPCHAVPDSDITNQDDQMEIISTVSWTERGFAQSVTLRDRLYNWK